MASTPKSTNTFSAPRRLFGHAPSRSLPHPHFCTRLPQFLTLYVKLTFVLNEQVWSAVPSLGPFPKCYVYKGHTAAAHAVLVPFLVHVNRKEPAPVHP